MSTDTDACRSAYKPRAVWPNTRVVRCGLPKGHDGDHDELIDGEPGVVVWADPEQASIPRLPKSVIDMADTIEASIGLRNISLLGLAGAAWLEGFKAGLGEGATYRSAQ